MAIFEDFIEIISRIHYTHTLHAVIQKFVLKYFRKRLKICEIREIKDLQKNLALYTIYSTIPIHTCIYMFIYALLGKYLRKSCCNVFVFLIEGGIYFSKRCSHTSLGRSGSALNFTGFGCLLPVIR